MKPIDPSKINDPTRVFNADHGMYNGPFEVSRHRVYQQLHEVKPMAGALPTSVQAKVRKDFIDTENVVTEAAQGNTNKPYIRRTLIGNFSAVRAAKIMHQHEVAFWTDLGVLEYVAEPVKPDPVADDAAAMYADFLLFNYLPLPMTPTQSTFQDMISPTKAAVFMRSNLPAMGIVTGAQLAPRLNDLLNNPDERDSTTAFLGVQTPFANNIGGTAFSNQPMLSRSPNTQ